MKLKCFLPIVIAFIIMSALDYLTHEVMLKEAYIQTADLWRSHIEIQSFGIYMSVVSFISLFAFAYLYRMAKADGSMARSLLFCGLYGLIQGLGWASCYFCMPITSTIAFTWLIMPIVSYLIIGIVWYLWTSKCRKD